MYNIDQLKDTYDMHNETEQKVLSTIIDAYPDVIIIKGKNIQSIDWCAKQLKGKNILILNAINPNLTAKGRNRITEFHFIHANGKRIWIDAKQQKTASNITDAVYGEITRAINCEGDFWYVCEGNGYNKHVINELNTHISKSKLTNKIKVIEFTEFSTLLK